MNLLTKQRLVCCAMLFLATVVRGADSQEQSFPAGNCAVTPPSGWLRREIKNQPDLIVAYGDPAGTRTILLLANQRGKVGQFLDEASAAEFDTGLEKGGGGPKTSGKFVQFAGFKAYERRGTVDAKGKHLTTLVVTFPTGDGIYVLEALAAKTEAGDDEDIRQSFNSFHFLRPPGPSRQPRDAAFRAGYVTGQVLMGLALLGVIVWAVTKAVSRRKSSPVPAGFSGPYPIPHAAFPPPPSAPPPLPPANPPPPPLPPPY